MLAPETILQDRYRIVRQLGQGGMGAVYEAMDLRLDTVVALKETLFTDEKLRKQFEREARLLARLHHQALPRVSDHFNEGEGQFLVMQFIPGEDLFEQQTHRNGPFPPADVLRWADQLCDALDYLHTQELPIIHRDIKPQNLKLSARGQIVLLDFGLAKGSSGAMSVVTTSASIFGYTPNYAPLEQVQGLGTDPRSDIYSLGATLYHLLTNLKPPDALSRAGAVVNGLPDPLVPADTVSPQVSKSVATILATAMSQKRDDRYSSAEEMRAAFQAASTGAVGEAPTVLISVGAVTGANTFSAGPGTQAGGQQTSAFGNEAQTLLADETTKVGSQSASTETATLVHSASTPSSSRKWLLGAVLLVVLAGVAGGFFIYRAQQSQEAQNVPPATPSPTIPAEATPVITAGQTATPDVKSANPKTETANQRAKPGTAEKPTTERKPTPEERRPGLPDPPPSDPPRHPPERTFPPRPSDSPPGHTFPNGTRVERRPDGTTVVTFPDGRTRVFPPGQGPRNPNPNPNRRRRPPN